MLHDVRALCFDLDDTLWDVQSVLARAEAQVADFLALRYPRLATQSRDSLRLARLELARSEPARAHDLTWLRIETVRRAALAMGYAGSVGEECFEVFIAARNEVTFFDDVLPALDGLGRRYRLATLSNGNADLERIGIASRFAATLSAREVGVAKPQPAAFEAVASALALDPAEIAYVGDDPQVDVLGARAAGLRTVWVNRAGRNWPDVAPGPDLAVADLAELERRLSRG
jgi:FMN hydrolase / 5-amino-6-(5-phospho-D-ribitylamino)uracil phosphatase